MSTKKTTALTAEERLEKAIVPVDEQPYEVPENWCWVKGNAIFQSMKTRKPTGATFRYIDIDSIDNKIQVVAEPKTLNVDQAPSRASRDLQNGDTIFSLVRPYLKNIAYIDTSLADCIGSTGFYVCRPTKKINKRFIYHLMTSPFVVDGLNAFMKGDNSPSIRGDDIESFSYPLPPLAEQQRIVDRIEELFTDLEKAKEKAQAILDSAEKRKFAILYDVFWGKYTEQWREENGCNIDEWQEMTLQAVCATKITDGTHKTPTYCDEENGVPFISAKDVTTGVICWDNIKYITPELHEELYARLTPQKDDVLLAKNGTTGVAAIVDTDKVFDLYVTLAVLRPNKDIINPRFLLHIVNSPICKTQFEEHLTGIGVPNLHLRDIKEVVISVPSIPEQAEIVRILDELLADEQRIKEAAEETLAKIELMKKAVLADAFHGRLGTNDPGDRPAAELLKEILI